MKPHFIALILLLLVSGSIAKGSANPHPAKKEKIEAEVLARVRAIPEVKEFLNKTPKSYHPDLIVGPAGSSKNYYVQVGISNFDQLRTSYYLVVDPKTWKIYFMDQACDTDPFYLLTLQQWRHWRKTPGWQKRHTYKAGKLVVLAKQ